jgi:NAD+ kinase
MKFGVITYNSNYPVKDFLNRVIDWCITHEHPVYISNAVFEICGNQSDISEYLTIVETDEIVVEQSEVIISVGGDGTLLRTARLVVGSNKPILGINVGRLGFLANVAQDKIDYALEQTANGHIVIDQRSLLEATLPDGSTHVALNEFLFSKGSNASMINLDAYYDGLFINRYWSDGLIVASPTGSTAYNMSAGGPIIMPGTNVMVLNPINPHTLTTRPLVLPSDKELSIVSKASNKEVIFSKDGEFSDITGRELVVKIRRSAFNIDLIKLPEQTYFDTLRAKLMWGMDLRGNKPDHT